MLSRVPLFATLWTDCCPTDSSVPGISQARILEWVAISSSRTKSWSSSVSCFSSKPASAPPTSVTYSQEESAQSVAPLSPRLLLCPLGFLQAQPGLLTSVSGLRALSLWTQRRSPCSGLFTLFTLPRGLPCSLTAPVTQPWLGALIPHVCCFSSWVFSPAISFFFTLSFPSDSSRLHPRSAHPVSALGSLTSSVIRGSGHITRRSPKSSRAELRNHLSGLGTQVSPSSSSCLHPCASGTLRWVRLPVSGCCAGTAHLDQAQYWVPGEERIGAHTHVLSPNLLEVKWCSCWGRQSGSSSKSIREWNSTNQSIKCKLTVDPQISFLSICPRN